MLGLAKLVGLVAVIALAGVAYLSTKMETAALNRPAPAPGATSAPKPARLDPAPASGGAVTLRSDTRGHYKAQVEVGGRRLPMLVDTGASYVSLSHEDARAAGLSPLPGDFTIRMNTANGIVLGAKVRVAELRLDTILMRDVEAVVMPQGALSGSLLGMSFLKRLRSFQFDGERLVLNP